MAVEDEVAVFSCEENYKKIFSPLYELKQDMYMHDSFCGYILNEIDAPRLRVGQVLPKGTQFYISRLAVFRQFGIPRNINKVYGVIIDETGKKYLLNLELLIGGLSKDRDGYYIFKKMSKNIKVIEVDIK